MPASSTKTYLILFSLFSICYCFKKLQVTVLYESLCPDSQNFIKYQLNPVWQQFGDYLNVKLVPFGKSTSAKNGTEFYCQHGPAECKGNRLQSCALNSLPRQNHVEYVNCFMEEFRRNPQGTADICSNSDPYVVNAIKNCHFSQLGTKLQLDAEKDTVLYAPRFVPTIIYDMIFDRELQEASLIDFKRVVCDFLTEVYPIKC